MNLDPKNRAEVYYDRILKQLDDISNGTSDSESGSQGLNPVNRAEMYYKMILDKIDEIADGGSGGDIDPAVIEQAVSDWLTAHPEATTTVADGSITYNKLDANLKGKADAVSSLSDEIDDIGSDVTDLKSAFNAEIPQIKKQKLNKIITGNVNVFDKTKAKTGKKISGGTEATDSSAFYCEIPVVEGDVIRFPYSSTYKNAVAYGFNALGSAVTWLAYRYFDASGNASSTELPNVQTALNNGLYVYGRNTVDASGNLMFTDDGSVTIGSRTYNIKKHIVPAGVTMMKINFGLSLIDYYMVTVNNSYPTSYQAYSEFNAENLLRELNADALNGKTMASVGDSIAFGSGNPQGDNTYKSYAHLMAEKHTMSLTSYAVTGATLCPTLDASNNICDQISTLVSSNLLPDIILVEGGINDIHNNYDYESNRGTIIPPETNRSYTDLITDSIKSTVCGSLEWIFHKLRVTYPNAIVVFIAVHRATARNMDRQKNLHSDEMAICEKWAIPVVNVFEEGLLNTKIEELRDAFTLTLNTGYGDGIHPNAAGYNKFYVPMIETALQIFIH